VATTDEHVDTVMPMLFTGSTGLFSTFNDVAGSNGELLQHINGSVLCQDSQFNQLRLFEKVGRQCSCELVVVDVPAPQVSWQQQWCLT
jgi:hypothetical protein